MLASRIAARSARVAAPRISLAATRGYAEPAKSAQNTKPPVALYGLDGTYASALYTAAAKQGSLDTVSRALDNLAQTFKRDTRLQNILNAPSLAEGDKKQIIAELQKSTNVTDKTQTLQHFLETLAENNRLSLLDGVCEKFGTLMSAAKGEVEMVITSASPLDQKVVKQLEGVVSKSQYVGQGKKLKVVPKVNPDIRGGLIVEIGDRTIDLSVSAKMARMNKLLQDTL
ncbi:ATP synthase F0 subcomplex subunit OSCP atp5 [Friedmanniomyces endolithicus]|uniref:ATP synthase subunit 5, mitochondrial n=1 Tax=Friedmanniomyces endolithicus TaxID=329885 RepID=A0AAN6FQR1_9PEZI|nr:ATP synthase F0 subcomplex subunit OSCP atp5 [Friedmanniomyces endolithicus]KAK0296737.1 ATP synthase F0 subcomplex subunit OSCP atp5 [Friedmanniomyces endolithicus]KAK0321583.1 ATP synthase F0 subcomplex subunit OSCP atp5 [Friedmanniomyces endolithicus]KAK1011263.1 ATP synthase F0 subcomplex subunit OSCP atp5 [Friedmanniomyces endolithicus]KAK1067683.1 ATP synthase F0 subcomplex subunit OSCP atp5 [Friedmanniomyces endolithicus]